MNDFIPLEGKEDIENFIVLKFNPSSIIHTFQYAYILWKLAKAGRLEEKLNKQLLEKGDK